MLSVNVGDRGTEAKDAVVTEPGIRMEKLVAYDDAGELGQQSEIDPALRSNDDDAECFGVEGPFFRPN